MAAKIPVSEINTRAAIMILLEQLLDAGIEEICLVIGKEDKEEFDRLS